MGSYNLTFSSKVGDVVWLPREEAEAVYNAFVLTLAQHLGEEYEEKTDINLDMMKSISLTDLSADDFNLAYKLIMAMDKLNPATKEQIKQAFESDPRFNKK